MTTPKFDITFEELRVQCEEGKFDAEYAEFINAHADSSVVMICNGQSLIMAMESGYLFDDFVDSWQDRCLTEIK